MCSAILDGDLVSLANESAPFGPIAPGDVIRALTSGDNLWGDMVFIALYGERFGVVSWRVIELHKVI